MRCAGAILGSIVLAGCQGGDGRRNPPTEVASLKAVNDAYQAAWLAGDSAGVLRLFAAEAVLLPHHGDPALVGLDAIRAFWWPPNTPATDLTTLDITTEGAEVQGNMGTLWGHFMLTFSYETDGRTRSVRNAGTYLMVLRRQPDGEWRITHRMWDDPVAQQN